MVSTRRSALHGARRGAPMNPPPPPMTVEQPMGMQAQLMQTMMQHIHNQPARGPPPVHVRDKNGEYEGTPPGVHPRY